MSDAESLDSAFDRNALHRSVGCSMLDVGHWTFSGLHLPCLLAFLDELPELARLAQLRVF